MQPTSNIVIQFDTRIFRLLISCQIRGFCGPEYWMHNGVLASSQQPKEMVYPYPILYIGSVAALAADSRFALILLAAANEIAGRKATSLQGFRQG